MIPPAKVTAKSPSDDMKICNPLRVVVVAVTKAVTDFKNIAGCFLIENI